jgi:hypothetical protein
MRLWNETRIRLSTANADLGRAGILHSELSSTSLLSHIRLSGKEGYK